MLTRKAFTMIELIFVIVVMGIIGKFGVEFLAQAYNTFIYSKINNELQSNSSYAVNLIAKRLESGIKSSAIKKISTSSDFKGVTEHVSNPDDYNVLQWISYDIDGFRGDSNATWSGIIDLNKTLTTSSKLFSPNTDTTKVDTLIKILSYDDSNISNAAIYFTGANYNTHSWGWKDSDTSLNDHTKSMHPINKNSNPEEFISGIGSIDFTGVDAYNRYMLSWTAYAVYHDTASKELRLYYDYQPWQGEAYDDGDIKYSIIMDNVSTFRIHVKGGLFSIIVCAKSDLITTKEYSICKEKIIF